MGSDETEWSGGCACGTVRWTHPGPKTRNLLCHCDECRRGVAAGYTAVLGLPVKGLVLKGTWQDYRYTPESSRGFCPACGTRLWFRSDLWPDEVFMNIGTLDDPARYVPDRHVVTGERVCWAPVPAGSEMHEGFSVAPGETP